MGGQACIFYGGVEFSRDIDLAILIDQENIEHLRQLLIELDAHCIAVPPFGVEYLTRGHAIHFRCCRPDILNVRLDIMSVLRGLDSFEKLWERRTTVTDKTGLNYQLLSLPDLVLAKKTQRDKDWPMIVRLLEAHYFQNFEAASDVQINFWLKEMRTPDLLIELAKTYPEKIKSFVTRRPLLTYAIDGEKNLLREGLLAEENAERQLDRKYWSVLKKELETIRHKMAS